MRPTSPFRRLAVMVLLALCSFVLPTGTAAADPLEDNATCVEVYWEPDTGATVCTP